MQFFCQKCETIHTAADGQAAICDVYHEIIAERIPDKLFWCFCCGCQTFWRLDCFPVKERALITACVVCDRSILNPRASLQRAAREDHPIVSYLCHRCNTISMQTNDVAKGSHFALSGPLLSLFRCPGCYTAISQTQSHHDCPSIGLALTTARHECYFCGEILKQKPLADSSSRSAVTATKPDPPQKVATTFYNGKARQHLRPKAVKAAKEAPPPISKAPVNKTPAQPSKPPALYRSKAISPSLQTRKKHSNTAVKLILAFFGIACAVLIATLVFKPDLTGNVAESPGAVSEPSHLPPPLRNRHRAWCISPAGNSGWAVMSETHMKDRDTRSK